MKQSETNIDKLATIHGLYYCAAGIWPLLHLDSFVLVTGPKTDLWMVKTVSVLVLAIGVGLGDNNSRTDLFSHRYHRYGLRGRLNSY